LSDTLCVWCGEQIDFLWYSDKDGNLWHVSCLADSRVPLLDALRQIAAAGDKTFLGRCCVERRCVPSEGGAACELQEKANHAFAESAGVAKAALEDKKK
jgi:hypothetical protein